MTQNRRIPSTQNEEWGFWGTMDKDAPMAWPIAVSAIAAATDASLDAVRKFLDSVYGRRFADAINSHLFYGNSIDGAIHAAIEQWMEWRIDRIMARREGLPRGLPYLTGCIQHAAETYAC